MIESLIESIDTKIKDMQCVSKGVIRLKKSKDNWDNWCVSSAAAGHMFGWVGRCFRQGLKGRSGWWNHLDSVHRTFDVPEAALASPEQSICLKNLNPAW